eukprot:5301442-Prymnesium_polylepis.1
MLTLSGLASPADAQSKDVRVVQMVGASPLAGMRVAALGALKIGDGADSVKGSEAAAFLAGLGGADELAPALAVLLAADAAALGTPPTERGTSVVNARDALQQGLGSLLDAVPRAVLERAVGSLAELVAAG